MATDLSPGTPLQTLDLTGLPESIIRQVTRLVQEARGRPGADAAATPPGPPESDDAWVARWRGWTSSRPRLDGVTVDDRREAIYDDADR
ncbi:MAG: hypothetical protein U0871_00975 [Gemmataceae bacterium]